MKTRNNPWLRRSLLISLVVLPYAHAQSVWTGGTDSVLSTGTNYSPVISPATASGLDIQFNGTDPTTGDLTLATAMGGAAGTAGSSISVLAGQTNALTITGTAGTFRFGTGLAVASGAGAVSFAGTGTFALGGVSGASSHTITNDSSNLLDFGSWGFASGGGAVAPAGGPRNLSVGGSGNIISNGNWQNLIALTKTGAGTLTLGGTNTFTAATTVSAGVLELTNAAALSTSALDTSGAGTVTVVGPTTLTLGGLTGSSNLASVITTGYSTLTDLTLNPTSGTRTYTGNIINGATGMNLVKSGAGTQVLSGTNTYNGTTSVNVGTLRLVGSLGNTAVTVASAAAIGGEGSIGATGSLTLNAGSTLRVDPNTAAALTVGGDLTFGGATNVILDSLPTAVGVGTTFRLLDYSGTLGGSPSLQNAADYRNPSISTATPNQVNMTIDSMSLVWSGGTAVWDVATTSNWDSGAELFYQGDAVTFNDSGTTKAVTLSVSVMPASVTFSNSTGNDYSLTGAGAIAGSAALAKSNTGNLTLSTPNTYSGGTTISGGKIIATAAGALGAGAVTNNATLDLTAGAVTYTGLSTLMTGNGIANVTLGTGSNTTVLNGDFSGFTGTINIGVAGGGKAQMTGADNAAASINVLSNGTLYVNANVTKNATVTLNGGNTGESLGQLRLEGGVTWAGDVILAGDITGSGDFTVGSNSNGGTISGDISETGTPRALSKGGPSTIMLSGANSYTGATSTAAGILKLGSAGALGGVVVKTSGLTVTGGTLDLFGQTPTAVVPLALNSSANGSDVGSLYNTSATTATWPGTVTFGATSTVTVGSGNIDLTGAITGASKNINKNGLNTLSLTNSGTVALGFLQANRGTIQVGSGSTLNVTGITVGSGNSVSSGLTLSGGSVTSSGPALFGTATSGTATGTLNLNSGTLTVPSLAKGGSAGASVVFNANFNGGTLKASAPTATFFAGANNAKVQAGGAFIDDGGFAITIAQPLIHDTALGVTPDGGLTKSGSSTLILSGANTYTGNTTVSTGTLELAATTGSLTFAPGANTVSNKVTGAGTATFKGTFNIDRTNAAVADNNSWVLADVSSKSFDASSFTVAGFTELPEGTWTLVDGSNTWTFTQSDATLRLDVAAAGYANWLTLYPGILDPAAGADPENDGIKNVLEYVLNGNPTISDPAILPDLDASGANFVFTFTRREESPSDTTQIFQYGTNLSGWTNVAITGTPGPEVTLGVPAGGLQAVTVTIPKSAAGLGGKLFGRLQAVKLP